MRGRGWLLGWIALSWVGEFACAGTLYRCDDGGAATVYQGAAGQREIARRDYPDAAAQASPSASVARHGAGVRRAVQRASERVGSTRTPSRRASPTADAFLCSDGAIEWLQSAPCRASRDGAAASPPPRQTPVARDDLCRRIREGRDRGASHERPADGAYRRNLLRDRHRC
jgi:hypothetical protein